MLRMGRLRPHLLTHLAVIGAALLFLFLDRYDVFDYILICPLHLFGLYCPTCGMTRAAHSILSLDLAAALRYHPLIFLLGATVLYYDAFWLVATLRKKPAILRRATRIPFFLTVAALLVYFILRNLLLLGFGIDLVGDFL